MQHFCGFVLHSTPKCFVLRGALCQRCIQWPLLARHWPATHLPRLRPPPAVRFRPNCLYDGPVSFSPGALPSALDDFLSTYQKPALLLINIV